MKQRLLTDTQLAVSIGYVALLHGTALDEEQIAELIVTRPRRVRAPRTVRNIRACLRRALNVARRDSLVTRNVAELVDVSQALTAR